MANSKIEWTDITSNPAPGCRKIAAGCQNCFAEKFAARLANMGQKKYQAVVKKDPETGIYLPQWNGDVFFDEAEFDKLRRKKKPQLVFIESMGDIFYDRIPASYICRMYETIRDCPHLTFQILTKRIERAERCYRVYKSWHNLPNVHLGVSCSTPDDLWMIDKLAAIQAAIRFASFEPLVAPVRCTQNALRSLDQVIVGGESGSGARPMHPQWARDIRDQCVKAGVPFFFKQWGRFIPWSGADRAWRLGGTYTTVEADVMLGIDGKILEIPNGPSGPANAGELNDMIHGSRKAMCFDRVGKKKAGRILDGRTWDQMPDRIKSTADFAD